MIKKIYPKKLKANDEVRVIAPSRSLAMISDELKKIAEARLAGLGLKLSFGKHVQEDDDFGSSSIASRVEDIHDAFRDQDIKAVITVIGGFNCNQLLKYLDWDLIRKNPKIFCGYSDITALNNAILTKTGLVSYSGPHYSTFGQELHFDHTLEYFKKCLFDEAPFEIKPNENWSDDAWYKNQKDRNLVKNGGYLVINERIASGTVIGGNLGTFNLLQGTEYFPSLENSILFLEDDEESRPHHFDRDLQSVIHLPDFKGVKGLVIGRFQKASAMTDKLLIEIIKSKKELDNLPVVANVDFGHTDPKITFPIGGEAEMTVLNGQTKISLIKH